MKAEVLIVIGLTAIISVTFYLNIIIGVYLAGVLFIGAGIFLAKGRR